jgi:hypothetical protein
MRCSERRHRITVTIAPLVAAVAELESLDVLSSSDDKLITT